MIYFNQFFFGISKQFRQFYLNSSFYDKKISKTICENFKYKPSPYLLSSLIKYQKKKSKIEDFSINEIWENKNIKLKDFRNLNSFYWFFSLDLKSSKEASQSIIKKWISYNHRYNQKSWDFDLTAKRIIAWLSCHHLTYEGSNQLYKKDFNKIIEKQTNHLVSEIDRSKSIDDKLIGCAAIILVGLCYNEKKNTYHMD